MLCLSDSNLVIRIAEFELLEETLEVLDVTRADVRILPELPHVLAGGKLDHQISWQGVERAKKFIKGLKLVGKVDHQEHAALRSAHHVYKGRTERIDYGEASLFAATKFMTDYIVATGDKKSLRTLAACKDCGPVYQRLKERVICLEQTVVKLIDHFGYAHVLDKVGPRCECEECLLNAFANGKKTQTEKDCRKWLVDYVFDLRGASGHLLVA